jgi:hypothetical protein
MIYLSWYRWHIPPQVKYLERESDRLTPSRAEVKNVWSYTSTSRYIFVVPCLIKLSLTLSNETGRELTLR